MDRSTLVANAKKHYEELKNRGGLNEVTVPEWGGVLHYPTTIPLLRRDRIVKLHAEGGLRHMAQIIIECARDENGRALLTARDMDMLLKEWDADVLMRVAGDMVSAITPPADGDEIAKNFAATGSSETGSTSPSD